MPDKIQHRALEQNGHKWEKANCVTAVACTICVNCKKKYIASYVETFGDDVPVIGCLDGKYQIVGSERCLEYPKTGNVEPTSPSRSQCEIVWEGNTRDGTHIGWYRCKSHGGGFSGKPFDPRQSQNIIPMCAGYITPQIS